MKILVRILMLVVLLASTYRAKTLGRFEDLLSDAKQSYAAADGEAALNDVLRAMDVRREPEAFGWLGDTASYVYRHDPEGDWTAAEQETLLSMAWEGYAGAVLRCPVDSWAWSGLAGTALRDARQLDREKPLLLGEIEERSAGVLNGRFAVALAAANIAVDLQPSGYQQLDVLGRVYEATGELDQAREIYARSARMMPAPSFHSWGAGRRLLQDLYSTILDNLELGLAIAPEFERSMLYLDVGRFAREQGDFETALENLTLAKAAAQDPYWTYEAARELAALYEEQGKFEQAIVELDVVRATGFGLAYANRKSASLHARLQRFDEACARFREAIRDLDTDAGLRAEAARACEAAGDLTAAEEFLKDGVHDPSRDLAMARALLEFYRRTDKVRTADSLIRAWVREYPESADLQKWQDEIGGGGR